MTIHLTPEQERIIQNALKSGRFRTAEEVVAEAFNSLRERQ
jgi:Arc/MetJ-type ribon-helix-helix transcriptional regulator